MKRRQARQSLIPFTEFTYPKYQPADCHKVIGEALDQVLLFLFTDGREGIQNLMIEAPPQHGKTELASRRFPALALGKALSIGRDLNVISATYNADRASDNSKDVRSIVGDDEFRRLFPGVDICSSAVERWHLAKRHTFEDGRTRNIQGSYTGSGVGTALTGRGGELGIIDDPFKDRKEADSERRQKDVWDWYVSTFLTRLQDGAPKLVINTRWHEKDLSGQILEKAKTTGEKWVVLKLQALTDGKALWPERFGFDFLDMMRTTLGPREWSSLYQQNPTAQEGAQFKRENARYYKRKPADLNVYMTSDAAVTEDQSADYSEIAVWGVDPRDNVFVLDWWHGQVAPDVYIAELTDRMQKWKPITFASFKGVIKNAIEPFLLAEMRKKHILCDLEWFSENTPNNKVANSKSFQALYNQGRVHWRDDDASERVISQLCRFPAGAYDDAVDTCTALGRLLAQIWGAVKPPDDKPFNPDEYAPTVGDFISESFSGRTNKRKW